MLPLKICAQLCFMALFQYGYSTSSFDPEQVRISTGSFDQMIIVWSTLNDTGDSFVLYGEQDDIRKLAAGTSRKFVDGTSVKRTQYVHKVILTGLEPTTTYQYKVGSRNYNRFSDIFSFRTWPEGNQWSPSLAIYGDLGFVNPQSLPRLLVDSFQGMYDAVLHVGDFGYNLDFYNGNLGDDFLRLIEPLAASLPYMTCPGNHEQAANFLEYRNRFEMPGDINQRKYYSFTMGPIRFISVDTEQIFFPQYGLVPIVEHYNWLKQQLEDANKPENRAKQPWVITFGHRPMYCTNNDKDDCSHHESLIRVGIPIYHLFGWEELYYQNSVDLAIWAHEHSYERLWPVYNRQVKNGSYEHPYTNPGATVHVTTGSAGCSERHDNFENSTEAWSAFRSLDYGYTRMKVLNASHLYIEQVSDDQEGKIIDQFTLIRHDHRSFPPDFRPVKPVGDPLEKLGKDWFAGINPKLP